MIDFGESLGMVQYIPEEGEPIMFERNNIEKIRYTNDSGYLELFRDVDRGVTLAYIRKVEDSEFPYRANVLFFDSELSCQNYDIALMYVYKRSGGLEYKLEKMMHV